MADDPLLALDNVTLYNTTLMLHIACARNPAVFRKKRRQYLCGLIDSLQTEATNRGIDYPLPPYHSANVRPHEL
jgi:hypothetical protein